MTRDELKRKVLPAIDRRAEEIVGLGERIRKQPEIGFKEVKTAALLEAALGRLGMSPRPGLAMTGVRGEAQGRAGDGPTFALIGKLDPPIVDADSHTAAPLPLYGVGSS